MSPTIVSKLKKVEYAFVSEYWKNRARMVWAVKVKMGCENRESGSEGVLHVLKKK